MTPLGRRPDRLGQIAALLALLIVALFILLPCGARGEAKPQTTLVQDAQQ